MPSKRIQPLAPTAENHEKTDRRARVLHTPMRIALRQVSGLTYSTTGTEALDTRQPHLWLCNHVSLFDPVITSHAVMRTIHYMATQGAMADPVIGRLLRFFGSVPKKKFATDVGAIRNLRKWAAVNAQVGVFPEGERSWDGRLAPLVPGIESLVRLLKLPVVTVRIINADRWWPRWGKWRKGHVHMDVDAPVYFDRSAKPEEVRAHIESRLSIDVDNCPRWPVTGTDLAHGLANPLFACPHCMSVDALEEKRDHVECQVCGSAWRVTTENTLIAEGDQDDLTIIEANDAVRAHYRQHWALDPERFERDGTIAESKHAKIYDMTGDEPQLVAEGRIRMDPESLHLVGAKDWAIPMDEMVSAAVELTRRLQFRGKERLYEVVLEDESVLKWEWLAHHWMAKVQGRKSRASG